MRTIACVNQKGGTGKTTTSVNLSAALAELGQHVLLIDLDPQYSTTTWLAVANPGRGVFDVFAEPSTKLNTLIRESGVNGLSVVPASPWLVGAEKALAGEPGAETILREKLEDVRDGSFDYLIIDCPPTLGVLTVNALASVDEVLVPVECHVMGLHGLAQLQQTVELVRKRLNPSIRISGIVPCRLDLRTNHGPEVVAKLKAKFPQNVLTAIRENVRLAECPSMGEPITSYAPTSPGAEDYRKLAEEILNQEDKHNERIVSNA